MTAKGRRGRPYKDGLPKEFQIPEHLRTGANADLIAGALETYGEYMRAVRSGEPAIIPDRLLIDREEAWQCSRDAQLRIEAEYSERVARSKEGSHSGAEATAGAARDRASAICKKNKDLIEKIKPKGHLTINGVAKIIQAKWPLTAPKIQDYEGSDSYKEDLSADLPPSVRTLRTYIKNFLALKQ